MNAREWGLLLVIGLVWGGSFPLNELALAGLPPLLVVALRLGLAAPMLLLAARVMGLRLPLTAAACRAYLVMGLLNNVVPFCLIVWGQTRITGGLASILNATTPLFTALLAHLLTSERLTAGRVVGVLLGMAGVAVAIGPAALLDAGSAGLLGPAAVLAATVCYGFAGIYAQELKGMPPLAIATGQVCASAMLLLPLALLAHPPWTMPLPAASSLAAVLGLALFSTAFAYMLFFRLLASAGATNAALVTLLVPVSAILLGAMFLGEALDWQQFAGMGLIAAGLAAIDGRALAFLRGRLGA